ncbi:putative Acetyltransferase-2 [Seiridium cardinale]|uniref:Acetyltransferase-2 n=1 Tax=Seiridium cardinale TaxID=138064 RepID=A0ABR2XVK4_9PEZI
MAPYTIAQCTVSDGAALTRNNIPAFWQDTNWVLSWNHKTLEQHLPEVTKRFPRVLINDRGTKRHQKALDPKTGRILGYARWHIPLEYATNEDGNPAWPEAIVPPVSPGEEAEIRRVAETAFWDPNTGPDVFIEVTRPVKNEILARKPYMRLEYLAVHPDNQGKGVGTALVESGMRQAEEMGLDIFIHAMKMGMGVYKRLGFRVEKELVMDDSPYGGDGDYRAWFLIYEQNRKPDL